MKRSEKTEPINISVPISLKRRMETHQEINWSATASRAFEKQLDAQEALDQLAEPDISEDEATERALKVQHSRVPRSKAIAQLEAELEKLLQTVEELKKEQDALKMKPLQRG